MQQADLIGWNWTLRDASLVVYPSAEAYAKYVIFLLCGPVLILACLTLAHVTPWSIWHFPRPDRVTQSLMDATQRQELERLNARLLEGLHQQLGDEAFARFQKNLAEKESQRSAQGQSHRAAINVLGWALFFVVGLFWAVLIFLAIKLVAALLRLPSASYTFARTGNRAVTISVPHLFYTAQHRLPDVSMDDVVIGKRHTWVGRYATPVWLWFVAIRPARVQNLDLPVFIVCDEAARSATGQPPEKVMDFLSALRTLLT